MLDKPAPTSSVRTSGPLSGFRVVEFAGIGPGPFACMMLADMGADVVTLDRVGAKKSMKSVAGRGRKVIELDLKDKAAIAEVLDLLASADALVEGFRPGVMERLGLGPDVVLARNPKLVYGRMTGWGQEGPLANAAGHDINYISITGALAAIGTKEAPVPPLNLVGDFGGGALYLVVGVLAALLEAQRSGRGQVVDAAMCDGAASLMSFFFDMTTIGRWTEGRNQNFLDGGRAFLRRLRMRLRPFRLDRLDRAAVLRAAPRARGPYRCRFRRADGPQGLARAEAEIAGRVQEQDPRGLVQDHGRHRHLLRPGADHVGSDRASAHGRPQRLPRTPRREAAGAGTKVLAHAICGAGAGGRGDWCGDGCVEEVDPAPAKIA
ncbi:crotonobetainyl-CoA:carnitine CoA-transferase CaiB-like acyl-CoA transferase [Bradyrhizobium japonicum]